MTNKDDERAGLGRRGFLGAFAGVASVAAAAVVGPQAVTEAAAQEPDDEKRKARYQETDHVQDYYRTNRY
jgi:nitrous oxide reductase